MSRFNCSGVTSAFAPFVPRGPAGTFTAGYHGKRTPEWLQEFAITGAVRPARFFSKAHSQRRPLTAASRRVTVALHELAQARPAIGPGVVPRLQIHAQGATL